MAKLGLETDAWRLSLASNVRASAAEPEPAAPACRAQARELVPGTGDFADQKRDVRASRNVGFADEAGETPALPARRLPATGRGTGLGE